MGLHIQGKIPLVCNLVTSVNVSHNPHMGSLTSHRELHHFKLHHTNYCFISRDFFSLEHTNCTGGPLFLSPNPPPKKNLPYSSGKKGGRGKDFVLENHPLPVFSQ